MTCAECSRQLVSGMYVYVVGPRRFCESCVRRVLLTPVSLGDELPQRPIGTDQFRTELASSVKGFSIFGVDSV